jgi:VanZ family protein
VSGWRLALPAYWVALAAATHYPRVRIPGELPSSDKILHFAAFAILAFLIWQVLARRARPLTAASVWIVAAIAIPYAAIDEYTQQFVGRYTELADWVANTAGIVCTLSVLELRRRITAARRSSPAPR